MKFELREVGLERSFTAGTGRAASERNWSKLVADEIVAPNFDAHSGSAVPENVTTGVVTLVK